MPTRVLRLNRAIRQPRHAAYQPTRPGGGASRALKAGTRLLSLLALAPLSAQASIFKGEALDKFADVLTVIVLVLVPIAAISVFWLLHVLPEKIAERRHHPQQTAIKTLCLLSLVFGGMLWPIAWLWAYTKPVAYKMAYGTDKHEHYFREAAERLEEGALSPEELDELEHELDIMAARNPLPPQLRVLRTRVAAVRAAPAVGHASGRVSGAASEAALPPAGETGGPL